MFHSRISRLVPLFLFVSLLAYFFLTPNAARAEGGEQIGEYNQELNDVDNGTNGDGFHEFYVDILSTGEVINVSLQDTFAGYRIYDPLGNLRVPDGDAGQLGAGSQGSCPTLGQPITNAATFVTDQPGPWRVVLEGEGFCWDISVTSSIDEDPDPEKAAGRLWTLRYDLYTGSFLESSAINSDFYAMTPGGLPDTNYVWLLDLNNFSGNGYQLNANDLGLDAPYSGYSLPDDEATVSDKFPLYLAYPAIANPRPQTPPIASALRFIDDEGVDVSISPGTTIGVQDTGYFEFDSDINGTYALTIDTDRNGTFAGGDRLLLGNAVRGLNRVQWDGRDPDGDIVGEEVYQAQLKLRGGEFHFISRDVETSGGSENGLTIRQANSNNNFTDVRVYWDDETYLGHLDGTSTLPDGAWSNTSAGHHTWGTYESSGIGNETYLDTYVYGQTTVAIIDAIVALNDNVVQSPQLDLDADDSSGATGGDYQVVWAADDSAQAVAVVDDDVTITDGDSAELTQVEIVLTTPQTDDALSIEGALPAGITLDDDSTDMMLRLTGTAAIDDYVTALGQVRFNNESNKPDNTQRTISLVLKDDMSTGNTVITTVFPDSDGDGVSDVEEGDGDSDLDTYPDYKDTDSDNDSIPDAEEGNADSDGDGLPDRVEHNTNDQDNDGIPDYLDIDSDDDGIRDGTEGVGDRDGDGLPNYLDPDSDGDGIPDGVEGTNDSDGDGWPDFLDTDSDDDGIPDSEDGPGDDDGDGLDDREESNYRDVDDDDSYDYQDTDSDGDGIPDGVEGTYDTDGDGFADYIDLDSDNDGIPDATEGETDADGDGIPDRLENNDADTDHNGTNNHLDDDDDGDGVPTAVEGREDVDNDGLPNYLDPDSDNDGIPDAEDGTDDVDGDGIPNFLDPDSDGDLIKDPLEEGLDSDGDGIGNRLENNDADTDGDGINNHLDPDDDGDGIPTLVEGDGDDDGDGVPNYLDPDSDGDGIPDSIEGRRDTDGDGTPDYLDTDSDDDGFLDEEEAYADADGDGIPDRLEHNENDADGDDTPDYLDLDSDGDGIPDADEGAGDADGDGIPNYLDEDSDNDGILDATEGYADGDGDGIPDRLEHNEDDADDDGTPDVWDTDSDGDGIPDSVEGSDDQDGDGVPNFLDLDSDGDGVPDAEEGAIDDAFDVLEDSENNELLVLGNDSDYDGDPLIIVAIGVPDQGGVIVSHGDYISYTPAPDFTGTETFIYSINDGKGNFDTALVTVSVENVNDEPISVDDAYTVDEDSTTSLDVLDNDYDIDPEDVLTISNVSAPDEGGEAVVDGDAISYTPATEFAGTETFTYTVSDGEGGQDTATVTVTVTGHNDDPIAVDDAYTVDEDSVDNVFDVLSNDSDAEMDALSIVSTGDANQGGAVSHDGSEITYTPATDFAGTETFTYTVSDGNGGQDTATVTVTVTNINDAPQANEDSFEVDEDSEDNALDVLDNDGDIDGDELTIADVGEGDQGGEVTVNEDDDGLLYTPDVNFTGTETFTYTISDGVDEHTGTVTVTVNNVNDTPQANEDSFEVDEDSADNVLDVLDNDEDLDGDALTIVDVGDGDQGGEVSINGDGDALLYTPAADFTGTETFTYTVSDGAEEHTGTVTVTVTAINDDPHAEADTFTVAEDATYVRLDVLANDSDAEGDELTLESLGAPDEGGALSIVNNAVRYTPARNFFGTETFTYTVVDGNGGLSTGSVTVTVTNVNDPPVAVDDTVTVDEDSVDNVLLPLANDYELDDEAFSLWGWHHVPDNGTVTRQGDTLIYTPNADFHGTDTIYYTISDGHSNSFGTGEITVIVTSINDDPVAVDDTFTIDEDSATHVFDVLDNDDDPVEGDPLSIILVDPSAQGGTVSSDGSSIGYTPAPNFFGTDTFTYTISDGNGGQDTATVTVTVNNVPDDPTGANDTFTVEEDSENNAFNVLDNDTDVDNDELTLVDAADGNEGGTTTVDGNVIRYTPAANFFGTETFTYTLKDATGRQDTATVTVTVNNINDAPVAANDTFSVNEDSANNELDVLGNDSDIENDALTITARSDGNQGGTVTINEDGDGLLYTPLANFFGTETFTYTVSDGVDETTGTVTVTVNNVNDAPEANEDNFEVDEDSENNELDVLANDGDLENDALTITAKSDGDNGGIVEINADGDGLIYTPDDDFFGTETFTYTVSDGVDETTGSVTVTVNNVNDAPEANEDTFEVDEDSANNELDVLANDGDLENDVLTITAKSNGNQGGTVEINAGGDGLLYTPADDFFGTETFTYTVSDGVDEQTGTVTVTVNNVNDAPEANEDDFEVDEDSANNVLDVLANDGDAENDVLTIDEVGDTDQGGTVEINADGDGLFYTPAADFFGTETFTYTVSDSVDETIGSVTVTVKNINDAPVAADDTFTVDEDSTTTLTPLDNDTDFDGDTLTISAVGARDNGGEAAIDGSTIVYTPTQNFNGEEAFTYTTSDGNGGVSTATITMTVTAVNDPPAATDDTFTVDEDSNGNMLDVLANDDDADGDALALIDVGAPDQGGTATIDGGVINYTPAPDFSGEETFTYTMSDGSDAEITGEVTVTVDAVNDAPQAANDGRTALQGEPLDIAPLANDGDVDGDPLSIVALGTPDQGGAVTLDGDTVAYQSLPDFVGVETFTYTVSDGELSVDGLVTVTVVEAVDLEQIDVTADTTLVYVDAGGNDTITATVHIPAGAMGDSQDSFALVYDEINAPGDPPNTFKFTGFSFSLNAYVNEVLQEGFVFQTPISITLQYGDEDVALLDESTLKLNYWDGENWQEDGITLVSHDEETNTIVFTLAHLTDFSLMAREPAMGLTKAVAGPGGGYLDLPLGAVVTYTLDLYNGGDGEATNLVLTDTLPAGVTFDSFVQDGGATYYDSATDVTVASGATIHVPAGTIVWSGSLASGAGEEIIFRAVLSDDTAYLGQTVTNTAYYRGDNVVDGQDEAAASFLPNTAPGIEAIADQYVGRNRTVGPLTFTVNDAETAAGDLVVTAASSNQDLFPDANLTLSGDGEQRAITLQPATDATGSATITITVDDGHATTTVEFTVNVVHFNLFIPMSAGG